MSCLEPVRNARMLSRDWTGQRAVGHRRDGCGQAEQVVVVACPQVRYRDAMLNNVLTVVPGRSRVPGCLVD